MADEFSEAMRKYAEGDSPGTPSFSQPESFSIFDEMFSDKERSIAQNLEAVKNKNPEEQVRVKNISNLSNLPPSVVEKDVPGIEKRVENELRDYNSLVKDTPETANYFEDIGKAAISHDDIDGIQNINRKARLLRTDPPEPGILENTANAFGTGFMQLQQTLLYHSLFDGKLDPKEVGAEIEALAKRRQEYEAKKPDFVKLFQESAGLKKEKEEAAKAFDAWQIKKEWEALKEGRILDALKAFPEGASFLGEAVDVLGEYAKNPKSTLYLTAEQFPNSVPSLLGGTAGAFVGALNPALGIASAAGLSYAGAYPTEYGDWVSTALQERGFNPESAADIERAFNDPKILNEIRTESAAKAKWTAMPDALMSTIAGRIFFPEGVAKSLVKGVAKQGLVKTAGKFVAKEAGEVGINVLGEAGTELSGRVAARGGEVRPSDVADAIEEGAMSLGQAVSEVALGQVRHAVEGTVGKIREKYSPATAKAATEVAQEAREAFGTLQEFQRLEAAAQAINESKTGQRSPGELETLLEEAGAGHKVYFQTDEWDAHFTGEQSPVKAAAELFQDDGKAYLEAKRNGTPMELPTSQLLTRTSAQDAFKDLLKIIRTRPDGMSLAEASETLKNLGPMFGTLIQEAQNNPVTEQDVSLLKEARGIAEGQKQSLVDAGYTPNEADAMVESYARVLHRGAKRTNQSPTQIASQYELVTQKSLEPGGKGQVFFQHPGILMTEEDLVNAGLKKSQEHISQEEAESLGIPWEEAQYNYRLHPELDIRYLVKNGEIVGHIGLRSDGSIKTSFINADKQGQGLGLEMYRALLNTGEAVSSDHPDAMEPAAKAIWEKLMKERPNEIVKDATGYHFTPKEKSFSQSENDMPRGQFRISPNRTVSIDLFKDMNLSTWHHEMGHFYLEMMGDLASSPEASQELKDDYAKILKFLGVEFKEQIGTDQHELWARSWETYLGEGKAPTPELQSIFHKFKVWMLAIYRNLRNLNAPLTDEIRGVMNRMLVSQEEIDNAYYDQGYDINPEAMGLTGETAKRFLEARERAKIAAEEKLNAKLYNDYERTRKGFLKEERDRIEKDVTDKLSQNAVYRAISILQKNQLPDGTPMPAGTPAVKLSKKAINQMYGKEFIKKLPKGVTHKDGVHPDIVAGMFGFENGDALLTTMVNTPDMKTAIQTATDLRMQEAHPDLIQEGKLPEEAVKAIHNEERSKLLRMQLDEMGKSEMPALKKAIGQLAGRLPSNKAIKAHAEKVISGYSISELKPNTFLKAQKRAAREAKKAFLAGDFKAAYIALQNELLNHELYMAAVKAQEQVDSRLEQFKPIFKSNEALAKSRDVDIVNAARAILAAFGLGKTDKSPEQYLKQMEDYDRDTFETLSTLISGVMSQPAPYDSITIADFNEMSDVVLSLWDFSRSQKKIEIDGQKMELDAAREELAVAFSETAALNKKEFKEAMSDKDKFKARMLGVVASLTRVEHWVSLMDKHDIRGIFRKYIYTPVSEATNRFRIENAKYNAKLKALIEAHPGLTGERISAPELNGYTFRDKAELIGHMLHMGNDSNLQKLLRGNKWGEFNEQGVLDRSRWDAFINRAIKEGIITKADFDLVQGVWDLHEELKPLVQAAHKEVYGFYFDEITAKPFSTPFGEYRGGYVPAKADPYRTVEIAQYEDKDLFENSNNSYAFPSTGKGATMSRIESYARPLIADLRMTSNHIDWALRFALINPRVREVARLLKYGAFKDLLSEHNPALINEMLIPFLQRAATQRSETPGMIKTLDPFYRFLRRSASFNIMGFNLGNAAQQLTGAITAASKVEGKYLRNALFSVMFDHDNTVEDIVSRSEYMKENMDAGVLELRKEINDFVTKPTKYDEMKNFVKKYGRIAGVFAQGLVNKLVWTGAYEQALAKGLTEKEAVRSGDSAVRLTQGSFNPEDISKFEAGTPAQQMFFMFMNFFNNQANHLGTEVLNTIKETGFKNREGASKLFSLYLYSFMLPTVFSSLMYPLFRGKLDEDDDEEYLNDFLQNFITSQISTAANFIPVVGTGVQLAVNAMDDKWYNDRISVSPVISILEKAIVGNAKNLKAMLDDSKEVNSGKVVRDAFTLMGVLTGGAIGQPVGKRLGYAVDVLEGKVEPSGPIDFTRGLLTGQGGQ